MAEGIIHADSGTLDGILASANLVLVDFYADWCGPCRMIAPLIARLAEEYRGRVIPVKVDVDEDPELAAKYGIMSIPTVIILRQGEEVTRIIGARPLDDYRKQIDLALSVTATQPLGKGV